MIGGVSRRVVGFIVPGFSGEASKQKWKSRAQDFGPEHEILLGSGWAFQSYGGQIARMRTGPA